MCLVCTKKMSILNYFSRTCPVDRGIFVPAPSTYPQSLSPTIVSLCNFMVETATTKTARTQVSYHKYSATRHAQIGQYTAIHGPSAASVLGYKLPEATARKFPNAYQSELDLGKGKQTQMSPLFLLMNCCLREVARSS